MDVIQPVYPKQFREDVCSDVFAFDQPGTQTQNDSMTGETVGPNPSNELLGGVVGLVWNDYYATMTSNESVSKKMTRAICPSRVTGFLPF
jgi:hypothetical protein